MIGIKTIPQSYTPPIQTMGFDYAESSGSGNVWFYLFVLGGNSFSSFFNIHWNINNVQIFNNSHIFDRVTQNSSLKKIQFVCNTMFDISKSLKLDFAILISDDVEGTNQEIIYENSFSTTIGIINVNEDLNIYIPEGKFIMPIFKYNTNNSAPIRNFKLELYA